MYFYEIYLLLSGVWSVGSPPHLLELYNQIKEPGSHGSQTTLTFRFQRYVEGEPYNKESTSINVGGVL